MGHLKKSEDGGGTRFYLDDIAVHAGVGLELRLPGNADGAAAVRRLAARHADDDRHLLEQAAAELAERWVRVRFEWEGGAPVLYVPVGGPWEAWRPPPGTRIGDELEVSCETCAGSGRRHPGDRCERCRGKGEVRGVVIGDPDRAVPCNGAYDAALPACDGGRVVFDRPCDDCDGRGKRWITVERPEAPTGILRGSPWDKDLSHLELRWPRRSST